MKGDQWMSIGKGRKGTPKISGRNSSFFGIELARWQTCEVRRANWGSLVALWFGRLGEMEGKGVGIK
jgi:hypothetical protein